MQYDVAIIGAGIAGLATAARLQSAGLSTIVLEAHSQPGGCAGFFRRRGFSFDVGATTLVDFEPGGVGAELLESVGMEPVHGEALPGYIAWLPDRRVTLYRDRELWHVERRRAFGSSQKLKKFWVCVDELSDVFWQASRRGIKLPIQDIADAGRAVRCIGIRHLWSIRYCNWTVGDALRHFELQHDSALVGLLSILIEDTVHSSVDEAPLINAALGISIRGAGLTRAEGGMRGFWQCFVRRYQAHGGQLLVRSPVQRITGSLGDFQLTTRRRQLCARQVVSAIPAQLTAKIAPIAVQSALKSYIDRDANSLGGAIVVFLGVPEAEVAAETFTHHQLLHSYSEPLGDGNNMFISVSASEDLESAPATYRAVMISTHCALDRWQGLSQEEYRIRKEQVAEHLIALARRVYPDLGRSAVVLEVGTPLTYERFTLRPRGAVGGIRQNLRNANQAAVPHDIGCRGFWLTGDTTWPGLGTVACVLGSRIVAEGVLKEAKRQGSNARTYNSKKVDQTRRSKQRVRIA